MIVLSERELAEVSPCGIVVSALERARTRFAIAVATEKKATPLEKYRHYLDIENRMRWSLRELRGRFRGSGITWQQAIETLKRIPDFLDDRAEYVEAETLCTELQAILVFLGACQSQPGDGRGACGHASEPRG